MKSFLRAILNWLDRKFPDKLEVTPAEYGALVKGGLENTGHIEMLEARIKALETQMGNINLTLGFTAPKFGTLER